MASEIFKTINQLSPEELERAGIIAAARKSGYICPHCGNGTGSDGTGMNLIPNTNKLKCHKCGDSFSPTDLIAAYGGYNQSELSQVVEIAKEMFGLTEENSNNFSITSKSEEILTPPTEKKTPTDYTELFKTAKANLKEFVESCGGSFRGLTLETLEKFYCGYRTLKTKITNPDGRENYVEIPRLIIPSNRFHYLARFVGKFADLNLPANVTENDIKPKQHFGSKSIFGKKILSKDAKFIFITEGEFDAMSIDQCGYPAISFSGSEISAAMKEELKEFSSDKIFIVLFDNDDTGRAKRAKAAEIIDGLGFYVAIVELDERFKDANEFLQADPSGLKNNLERILQEAKDLIDERKKNDEGISVEDYFKLRFMDEVNMAAKFADRTTGFKNLDSSQIFLPGLYLLGGVPAAGKSTFAWQLLEQLAKSESEKCIYCSYEMSPLEMFSKMMAREVYRRESENYSKFVGKALTAAEIRRGNIEEHLETPHLVPYDLSKSKIDLHLINLANENVDTLIERFRRICAHTKKNVTFCIDYLQILPHGKDNAKTGIDDTIRKLKVFQRETNCTLIVISSLNRQHYNSSVSMEGLKESGNVEYTADVAWGLQLFFSNDVDRKNDKLIDETKKKIPRGIELKCLKNRNGGLYSCYFKYLPHVDTFLESDEKSLEELETSWRYSSKKVDDVS